MELDKLILFRDKYEKIFYSDNIYLFFWLTHKNTYLYFGLEHKNNVVKCIAFNVSRQKNKWVKKFQLLTKK